MANLGGSVETCLALTFLGFSRLTNLDFGGSFSLFSLASFNLYLLVSTGFEVANFLKPVLVFSEEIMVEVLERVSHEVFNNRISITICTVDSAYIA